MTRPPASPPGYRTQSLDTSYEAERLLVELYRAMSPAEKLRRIAEDCKAVEQLAIMGIRLRYPDASEDEVVRRLAALRLGRALAIEVFGSDPAMHGY